MEKTKNNIIDKEDDNYKIFCKALNMVNTYLSKQMAKDGEGATKLIECEVINASDIKLAKKNSKICNYFKFGKSCNVRMRYELGTYFLCYRLY